METHQRENPMRAAYAGRRVCVTGGGGFIGGHLAEALLLLGARVTIIDDLSNSTAAHAVGLAEGYPDRARFVYGSILDPKALADAVRDSEFVFHLAAMNSVPRSLEEPERAFEVNAIGTLRVAEASRAVRAARLVYAGSSSAYGDDPVLPKNEAMLPRPLSPYGASKLAGESIVRAWACSYGLASITLRFFNVFGPRQPGDSAYSAVVAAFLSRLHAGQRPIIFGDGSQTRDFTPVANAVHALLLAGSVSLQEIGPVVNIAMGEATSIRELASVLARLAGREQLTPEFRPARRSEVPHSVADISLARRLLGYDPVKSLEEGLSDAASWYESVRTSATPVSMEG